jgi:3-oxoacyl-[acyl-carrier-protein] synthase III
VKFHKVRLASFGVCEPEQFISSAEIEHELKELYLRAKLPEGRLELQTGIKTRGLWPKGTASSSIAAKAANKALGDFPRDKIDLLLHTSVCRDFLEPATAAKVHHLLGLSSHCLISDVSNACLGLISGILLAGQMIEAGTIRHALLVSGENGGPLLEETIKLLKTDPTMDRKRIKPFIASLTIGSAGVAFLLSHQDVCPKAPKILGATTLTDTSAVNLCQGDGSSHGLMMETDSEALMIAGVNLARSNFDLFLKHMNWDRNAIDKLIPHQVGSAHRMALLQALELPMDRDFLTFDKYGNTGSAALPLTLVKAAESGFFRSQDKVALLGIGSGLTSTMLGMEWQQ